MVTICLRGRRARPRVPATPPRRYRTRGRPAPRPIESLQIQQLVGSRVACELRARVRGRCRHLRAASTSKLHRHVADSTATPEDQHTVPGFEPTVDEHALPRGQRSHRRGRAADVVESLGLEASRSAPTIANSAATPSRSRGSVRTRDRQRQSRSRPGRRPTPLRKARTRGSPETCPRRVQLVGCDGRRMNAHEGFPHGRLRNVDVLEYQPFGTTRLDESDRAHGAWDRRHL